LSISRSQTDAPTTSYSPNGTNPDKYCVESEAPQINQQHFSLQYLSPVRCFLSGCCHVREMKEGRYVEPFSGAIMLEYFEFDSMEWDGWYFCHVSLNRCGLLSSRKCGCDLHSFLKCDRNVSTVSCFYWLPQLGAAMCDTVNVFR
jgi:hypothetical protein